MAGPIEQTAGIGRDSRRGAMIGTNGNWNSRRESGEEFDCPQAARLIDLSHENGLPRSRWTKSTLPGRILPLITDRSANTLQTRPVG
jgi:hypothetical protein